jgi:hypothetical protein
MSTISEVVFARVKTRLTFLLFARCLAVGKEILFVKSEEAL